MADTPTPVSSLNLAEAARWLNIDDDALKALARARFIKQEDSGDFALTDLKAFSARNSDSATVGVPQSGDIQDIIDGLDTEIEEFALRAQAIFSKAVVETRQWTEAQRSEFVQQARARFGAILAVMSQGTQVDSALRRDLQDVGANAAGAGASLPHLELILRISRDLLLQRSMKLAEQSNGRLNSAVDAFIARLLPAIDNLLDAISSGFWRALLERSENRLDQLSTLVEKLPYPIYEVDLDGLMRHVNAAFCRVFGRNQEEVIGVPLADVVKPIEGDVAALLAEPQGDAGRVTLVVESPIGGNVRLEVDTVIRRTRGAVDGFAGLMLVRRA